MELPVQLYACIPIDAARALEESFHLWELVERSSRTGRDYRFRPRLRQCAVANRPRTVESYNNRRHLVGIQGFWCAVDETVTRGGVHPRGGCEMIPAYAGLYTNHIV